MKLLKYKFQLKYFGSAIQAVLVHQAMCDRLSTCHGILITFDIPNK